MKYSILILEDNMEKVNLIKDVVECTTYQIEWASDIEEMKKSLRVKQYDVILIDMYLPVDSNGFPDKEGGLNAIQYIRRTKELIFRPKNIIIMSEHVDEDNMFKALQDRGYGYPIISFSWSDDSWKDKLTNQIEVSIAMAGSKADVFIAVAVDVELESVWKTNEWNSFVLPGDDAVYYSLVVENKDKYPVSIVLCKANRMGPVGCTNMVAKAIRRFSPSFVIMVGIAAGKKGSTNTCDIVVAEKAGDYSYGKISEKNKEIIFESRAETIEIDKYVRRVFDIYRTTDKDKVYEYIRDETKKSTTKVLTGYDYSILEKLDLFNIIVGKVVSGPCVVTSDIFVDKYIKRTYNDYKALDMETYSLYYAAKNAETDSPIKFVSIKAISDMGDTDKDDLYQQLCVLESFNLAMYFIINDMEIT